MAYDCLNNLIGITASECDCTIEGLTNEDLDVGLEEGEHWYTQTTSGLLLDDLEGIVPLKSVDESAECENEMANWYYRALNSAIQQMADDILIGLTQRAVNGKKTYTGKVAGTSYGSMFNVTAFGYAGLKLYAKPMKGGKITINKIYTMMDAAATFDILVYKQINNSVEVELLQTISDIASLANAVKTNDLTTPVTLDLSEYGCNFFLLYVPNGFNPRTNSTSCGCGAKEILLRNFLQVNGAAGNDITNPNNFTTYSNAMGIALDAVVGCDTTKIICESFTNDDGVAKVMAYAARFKAGELVHEFVSKSGNINRYTMTSQESIWGKRSHFRSEYNARINWLVANLDLTLIDCYKCNDKRITKGGIKV